MPRGRRIGDEAPQEPASEPSLRRAGRAVEAKDRAAKKTMVASTSSIIECALKGADGREHRLVLEEGRPLGVGRDLTEDLSLPDAGVSRHHAALTLEGGELWVEDLHSHNGTFVNSKRVQRSPLHGGDIVTFGRLHLSVHLRDIARPAGGAGVPELETRSKDALLEVARTLTSALPPAKRLRKALERARSHLDARRALALLASSERADPDVVAATPPEAAATTRHTVGSGTADEIFEAEEALPFGARASALGCGVLEGHVRLGILWIEREESARPFGEAERAFLTAAAPYFEGALASHRDELRIPERTMAFPSRASIEAPRR